MTKTKTLVKICGITTEQQAIQIAQLGADAIGIISVEESPRYIPAEIKRKIFKTLESLYPEIERVSVLKNCPIDFEKQLKYSSRSRPNAYSGRIKVIK